MSYTLTIQPCKFIDCPGEDVSYGYRCYDPYGSSYNNTWEEEDIRKPPLEILRKIVDDECISHDDNLKSAFSFIVEHGYDLEIGGTILDWELVKDILTGE